MKFNEKQLANAGQGPADIEGRLNHRRAHKSGLYLLKAPFYRLSFTQVSKPEIDRHLIKISLRVHGKNGQILLNQISSIVWHLIFVFVENKFEAIKYG